MNWLAAHKVGVWAFLVTVAFVPGIMSAAIVPRWAVIALGIPLVSQIRWQIPTGLQLAIAAGVAWSAATILRAPDQLDSLLQFFFMLCLIGVMGVASQIDDLTEALSGMCWGLALSALACIVAREHGHFLATSHVELFPGLFYNAEVLVELCAPLLVWAAVTRRWHFVVIAAVPIMLNNSRIPIVAVMVGLMFAFWPKGWRARVALGAVGLALASAVVVYMTFGHFKLGSAAGRMVSWLTAAYAITPAGQGFGWFRATHGGEEFAHSDVLQAFAEIGAGALLFVLIPVYALRNRRDHAERAAFVVICAELVVSFPIHVPATGFLAALLAGYLVRDRLDVRGLQYGRGDPAGDCDGWHPAAAGASSGGGRRRSFNIPFGPEVAELSALGLSGSRAAGVR